VSLQRVTWYVKRIGGLGQERTPAQQRLRCGVVACSSVSGAPRSMKVGTILSPCPYDAAACHALQSPKARHCAFLRYASCAAAWPISWGGPVTLSIAAMPGNTGGRRDGPATEVSDPSINHHSSDEQLQRCQATSSFAELWIMASSNLACAHCCCSMLGLGRTPRGATPPTSSGIRVASSGRTPTVPRTCFRNTAKFKPQKEAPHPAIRRARHSLSSACEVLEQHSTHAALRAGRC
jgi:hypothetical protein